jgi:hypothetical protein
MAANRKILLRPSEAGHYEEKRAGAAGIIVPSADGYAIVREDTYQGRTVDDAYADEDVVFLYHAVKGDRANLLLTDGQTITIGEKVAFAASGKLVAATTETDVWVAEEELDLSSVEVGDGLLACRKL